MTAKLPEDERLHRRRMRAQKRRSKVSAAMVYSPGPRTFRVRWQEEGDWDRITPAELRTWPDAELQQVVDLEHKTAKGWRPATTGEILDLRTEQMEMKL